MRSTRDEVRLAGTRMVFGEPLARGRLPGDPTRSPARRTRRSVPQPDPPTRTGHLPGGRCQEARPFPSPVGSAPAL